MSVSTPCVKRCALDEATGQCRGCGRSLAEIGGWGRMSEAERRAVMAHLPGRLAGLAPAAVPDGAVPRRRR